MLNTRFLILGVLIIFNIHCQSPSRLQEFDGLILGQEKADVLDAIGNPTYKERIKGQDRWTYIIYEDQLRAEKVIYFLDGFITYTGLPIAPLISAEEQDQINRIKNIHMQELERMQSREYRATALKSNINNTNSGSDDEPQDGSNF